MTGAGKPKISGGRGTGVRMAFGESSEDHGDKTVNALFRRDRHAPD